MEVGIIVIVAVVVLVGLAVAGYATGKAGSPPTISLPGDGTSGAGCPEACARWDNARQMQCNARADEAAARSRADAIRGQMLSFLAAAVSLLTAGALALAAVGTLAGSAITIFTIPLIVYLAGIAIGFLTAGAAAAAAAAVFAGQLIAAEQDASAKSAARAAWDAEVAKARNEVNMKCSLEEANACLGRPAPC
jgi:hypothetical protein